MELKMNWLRAACLGVLAVGIASMPLTATAQTDTHAKPKKHKVSHTKKKPTRKTKSHKAHHSPKMAPEIAPMATGAAAATAPEVSKSVPPPEVVPTGPIAGKAYDESTWRGFHSDWNGQYHYSAGKYFYDEEFKYPAQIPNDFNSVASRFGGVATLDNDPTLIFSGDEGQPYPILEYNADRYKSDKRLKLKSAYFGRAYFWREGVRYDRKIIVNDKGERCFQFVKHA